jgi:hypothetical protein
VSTFGYTTDASSTDLTNFDWTAVVSPFSLSEAGTISKLTARIANTASGHAACSVYGLLYANNAGAPGALLASTPAVSVLDNAAKAAVDLAFPSAYSAAAGTYHLGLVGSNTASGVILYSLSESGTAYYNESFNPDSPPNPFGSEGSLSYTLCVWATYTPAASGLLIPIAYHYRSQQ